MSQPLILMIVQARNIAFCCLVLLGCLATKGYSAFGEVSWDDGGYVPMCATTACLTTAPPEGNFFDFIGTDIPVGAVVTSVDAGFSADILWNKNFRIDLFRMEEPNYRFNLYSGGSTPHPFLNP